MLPNLAEKKWNREPGFGIVALATADAAASLLGEVKELQPGAHEDLVAPPSPLNCSQLEASALGCINKTNSVVQCVIHNNIPCLSVLAGFSFAKFRMLSIYVELKML